jgi:hypothetical protein
MRILMIAAAAGTLGATALVATPAAAQYGYGYGYGRNDVSREMRECRRELRRADSRREYRRELRECQREIARARYGGYNNRYYGRSRYDQRYWDGYRWRYRSY